jgi:lysophospholipase L1-like esterase
LSFAREQKDPHCLSDADVDRLLAGAPWRRFVVVGDSIAEGVLEPVEGYRPQGWTDRLADALRRQQPELAYLNLARRGLRARHVRETQLGPALEFRPDLAAVVCGGNDLLVEHFDPGKVERELDRLVAAFKDAGAEVITSTLYDITKALQMPPEYGAQLEERLHELFERIGCVADRHRTLHVDFHDHPACADPGIYSSDFQHANARGHAVAAAGVIERLGGRLRQQAAA